MHQKTNPDFEIRSNQTSNFISNMAIGAIEFFRRHFHQINTSMHRLMADDYHDLI